MMRPLWLVILLCISLFSVTALAYASPPDPLWIDGIYDGADEDDAVWAIAEAAWSADLSSLDHLVPQLVELSTVHCATPARRAMEVWSVPKDRAPPVGIMQSVQHREVLDRTASDAAQGLLR
jgi:hypothetical protein